LRQAALEGISGVTFTVPHALPANSIWFKPHRVDTSTEEVLTAIAETDVMSLCDTTNTDPKRNNTIGFTESLKSVCNTERVLPFVRAFY
jgi:hypothetical protein